MPTTREIRNLPLLNDEARQAVAAAFDALEKWRDEIFAANDRCLSDVLDRVAAAHRTLGWSDQATMAAKEHLLKASKTQADMIDQVVTGWRQTLGSTNVGSGTLESLFRTPTPTSGFAPVDPASEMLRIGELALVPFRLWMQTAEAWQRQWAAALSGSTFPMPPRTPDRTPTTSRSSPRAPL